MGLIAGDKENWPLAGDQLYVNFDLSVENTPAGQKLGLGPYDNVILEISDVPHTGCKKFMSRFGKDATLFINANKRTNLRLRGVNARVIKSGNIRVYDSIQKID